MGSLYDKEEEGRIQILGYLLLKVIKGTFKTSKMQSKKQRDLRE